MSRYLAHPKADPPHIERLPRGTPRTEGQSLKEAKQAILDWLRYCRGVYAYAAKAARRMGPSALSLADILVGATQTDMSWDENNEEYQEEEEEGAEGVEATSPEGNTLEEEEEEEDDVDQDEDEVEEDQEEDPEEGKEIEGGG